MKLLNYIVFYGNKILKFIGSLILAAILLVITAGIISRYVFGKPFTWTEELTTFLMVNLGYISAAIVTIAKKHIVADFLISKSSPKLQSAVPFLSKILAISVFMLICISSYYFLPNVVYRTAALGLPRNLFYFPLFSMSIFMAFVVLVDILNDIFPGYNIQEKATQAEDELAMEEELMEAKDAERQMNTFLHRSVEAGKNE